MAVAATATATALAPRLEHYARLIDEATPASIQEAVDVARACIRTCSERAVGYELLGRALCLQGKFDDAVACYKTGLEVDPSSEELQSGLRSARIAVANALISNSDGDDEQEDALSTNEPDDHALISEAKAKVGRILEHLDVSKLSRLATFYILTELLHLKRVTLGLVLLLLGVFGQALVHRHKFMLASMLFVGLFQSKVRLIVSERLETWARTSSDKLGAFTWAPRVVCFVPIAMKVFGQLKFILFLQRDAMLSVVVFSVTAALVFSAQQADVSSALAHWGRDKRLKFVAYATAILYWGVWRGEAADTLRLLPPALIDAGGIVLASVTSDELQTVASKAWRKLSAEVASNIQQDVDLNAWFVLGLGTWVVDYWQQPSDFSLEMLTKMLSECFSAFETTAVGVFQSELRHLKRQVAHMGESKSEMALLVAYLKQSLEAIPPPKSVGLVGLFAKRCASFIVLALLIVFYGSLALPLAPFLWSEAHDARTLYDLYTSGELDGLDGLEILLLESPLLRVWENVRAAVYCLEGSVTLSRAVETGTQIMTAAMHLSRLATFAARLKTEGVAANVHELPDHLSAAYRVAHDSSAIVEGLKHVYASAHFQDLQTYVVDWWRRKAPPAAAAPRAESE